jgi:hypothetical protein
MEQKSVRSIRPVTPPFLAHVDGAASSGESEASDITLSVAQRAL